MGRHGSAGTVGWFALLSLPTVGLLAAGCSSGAGNSNTAASTTTSRVATSTTSSGGQQGTAVPSPYYEVQTASVSGLGTILVDGQGLTLYMFVPDDQRGKSTCYNECASGWPPLRLPAGVTKPVAAGQAEGSLLGTTTRTDGGLQVTYNGWPLYTWAGDSGPGQATGQGLDNLGGVWYVLSPKGEVIKTKL